MQWILPTAGEDARRTGARFSEGARRCVIKAPLFSSIFERGQIIAIILLVQLPIIRLALKLLLPTLGQQELPLRLVRRSNGERLHFVGAGLQSSDLAV